VGDEIQFTYFEDGALIKIWCPCGREFVIPIPAVGETSKAMCPTGCGHGLAIDRRIRFDRIKLPGPVVA
jgi:hypothetical protein